jgi:hypothetical protein
MRHHVSARIGDEAVSAAYHGDVQPTPEDAIAAFLLPAMSRGAPLTVEGAPSARLLDALPTLQEIISTWWPQYRQIDVWPSGGGHTAANGRRAGTACFFSGGVDSFYTALTRREDISHLVIVRGFDIDLRHPDLWERAVTAARRSADALGKPLLEIETDLRAVTRMDWEHFHGCALASVGHQLGHKVGRVLVPATHTYKDLFPWGSHPLLDPLWSSDRVVFEHHGADATRFAKVQAIAHDPVVLRHLRVCWRNPGDAYNCGRCEKCIRTMIALHLAGTLGECATLPRQLDYTRVARLLLLSPNDVAFADENIAAAKATGDERLVNAIRAAKAISFLPATARRTAGPEVKRFARRVLRR